MQARIPFTKSLLICNYKIDDNYRKHFFAPVINFARLKKKCVFCYFRIKKKFKTRAGHITSTAMYDTKLISGRLFSLARDRNPQFFDAHFARVRNEENLRINLASRIYSGGDTCIVLLQRFEKCSF